MLNEGDICTACGKPYKEIRFHMPGTAQETFRRALMCECDPDKDVPEVPVDQIQTKAFRMVKHSKPEV